MSQTKQKKKNQNQNAQTGKYKKKYLSPNEPVPEDIHWEWLEVIKAAQAACRQNGGFAQFTITVSVHHNKPILWAPAEVIEIMPEDAIPPGFKLLPLSPKRVSEYRFTSEVAAALMALHNGERQ
jgi:hypothetical protein